ncbi:MAG: hypothetical protein JXB26_06870 [Candidatus Aminicenantes bacterium]|nr:hypothetical protein [Candidatus Aminicenantes bacterium]
MKKYASFSSFVIIMDEDLIRYPDHWSVVFEDNDLGVVEACRQFDSVVKEYPRDKYSAEHIKTVLMIHTPSGNCFKGGIYRLSKISRGREKGRLP